MEADDKCFRSALVIVPSDELWEPIQAIRKDHDKAYQRWMPHINIIYPFVDESNFNSAVKQIKSVFNQHFRHLGHIQIDLSSLGLFHRKENSLLHVVPSPNDFLCKLQNEIFKTFPGCNTKTNSSFTPHLTLGQLSGDRESIQKQFEAFSSQWKKSMRFSLEALHLISRNSPDSPFEIKMSISFPTIEKKAPLSLPISNRAKESIEMPEHNVGDWFTLNRILGREQCISTTKELTNAVISQVERNLRLKQGDCLFQIIETLPVLLLNKGKTLADYADQPTSNFCPILTYHGTQDPNKVQSIADNGYVFPWEVHPTQGYILSTANGSLYGEGIYSSCDMDIAHWFSFLDREKAFQVIVNIVFLGTVHFICDDPPEEFEVGRSSFCSNPDWDSGIKYPVHGVYGNGAHTRIGGERFNIIVTGSSSRIVPVLVLTLQPKSWDLCMFQPFLTTGVKSLPQPSSESPIVTFQRFGGDLFTMDVPSDFFQPKFQRGESVLRHHVVFPSQSFLVSHDAIKSLSYFCGAFPTESDNQQHHLVIYDPEKIYSYWIHGSEDCLSYTQRERFSISKDNITVKFLQAVEKVLESVEKSDQNEDYVNVIYLFIAQNVCGDGLSALTENHSKFLAVKRSVVKLIFLNREPVESFYQLKTKLQTESLFEEFAFTKSTEQDWEPLFEGLLQENRNIQRTCGFRFAVPYPLGRIDEGFVLDLSKKPEWDVFASPHSILYKGTMLPAIWIDQTLCRTHFLDSRELSQLVLDTNWIRSRKHKQIELEQRRIQKEAEHKLIQSQFVSLTSQFSQAIVALLSRFRLYLVNKPERFCWYEGTMQLLCSRLIEELEFIIQHQTLSSLCNLSELRRVCFHTQTLANEITLYANVSFQGKWFSRLNKMRFGKRTLKRVKHDFKLPDAIDADDILLNMNDIGFGVRARRIAASQAEPWRIIIDIVSPQSFSIREVVVAEQAGVSLFDSTRQRVTDIIPSWNDHFKKGPVLIEFRNTRGRTDSVSYDRLEALKMYYAWVFHRNCFLYLEGQSFALLAVSWVRSMEMIFRKRNISLHRNVNDDADYVDCHSLFATTWDLASRIAQTFERDSEGASWIQRISEEQDMKSLSWHLTYLNDVQSMCRLLAVLLTPKSKALLSFDFDEERFRSLSFLMLAECAGRAARACQQRFKLSPSKVIRQIMGLNKQTDLSNYSFDILECASRTSKFFHRRYTNCTPFALVAALGFVQRWHQGMSAEEIWQCLWRPAKTDQSSNLTPISMGRFLLDCMPQLSNDRMAVQLALFLHSMKYHDAAHRKRLDFSNPRQMIQDIVDQEKKTIEHEQTLKKSTLERKRLRQILRQQAAESYRTFHSRVKLFTEAEVAEMNTRRPQDDQLERLQSGLLKYHCCHPNCPQYLVSFKPTEEKPSKQRRSKQRLVSKSIDHSRQSLMHHLRHDHVLGFYLPSFHLVAMQAGSRKHSTFDSFSASIFDHFKGTIRRLSLDRKHLQEHVTDAWEFWHRKNP